MRAEIRVETWTDGALIFQEVTGPRIDWKTNARDLIAREVMNTKDQQTRDALIRMGWVPPKEDRLPT